MAGIRKFNPFTGGAHSQGSCVLKVFALEDIVYSLGWVGGNFVNMNTDVLICCYISKLDPHICQLYLIVSGKRFFFFSF